MKRRRIKRRIDITDQATQDLRDLVASGHDIEVDFQRALAQLRDTGSASSFDDHALKGQLRGWRAFAIGPQDDGQGVRVVYFTESHASTVVAAGPHDEAYHRAQARRRRA